MESLVRGVEKRFSGFGTRTTKRTTVLDAKLGENFLRIVVCPGYCDRSGLERSKNSRPSSVGRFRRASVVQDNDSDCAEPPEQAFGTVGGLIEACQSERQL